MRQIGQRKLALAWLVTALVALGLTACYVDRRPESQAQDQQRTEDQQAVYARNQPVPRFQFSQTRDTLIQLYQMENEARTTYTTFHSNGTGEVIFACPSRGYAVPADTQLTNPLQVIGCTTTNCPLTTIEQPEPNGVYSSKNTDGTYVLCVRADGKVTPVYTELKVTTFPYEVEYDPTTHQVRDVGKTSSSSINLRAQADAGTVTTPSASPAPSPAPGVPQTRP